MGLSGELPRASRAPLRIVDLERDWMAALAIGRANFEGPSALWPDFLLLPDSDRRDAFPG